MRTMRFAALALVAVTAASVASAQQATKPRHHTKAEAQAQLEKEARIKMPQARALAVKAVRGAWIETGGIEREGATLLYRFDMRTRGKSGSDEVSIDAMTGKVLSRKHETPKGAKSKP
jgi:uncharacterized membrane protein YkoI